MKSRGDASPRAVSGGQRGDAPLWTPPSVRKQGLVAPRRFQIPPQASCRNEAMSKLQRWNVLPTGALGTKIGKKVLLAPLHNSRARYFRGAR